MITLGLSNDDGGAVPPWMVGIALIIGAIILVVAVVFLGLCVASMFLPVILALVGILLIWRGSKGNPQMMIIGLVLMLVGVLLWMWT